MDDEMKHHSIKAWEDAPPPLIIRSLDTGRELFRINADGSVVGEIEDASEAAKVFFESLRGYLPQPQTDVLKIAREALEAFIDRFDGGARADTEYVAGLVRNALEALKETT